MVVTVTIVGLVVSQQKVHVALCPVLLDGRVANHVFGNPEPDDHGNKLVRRVFSLALVVLRRLVHPVVVPRVIEAEDLGVVARVVFAEKPGKAALASRRGGRWWRLDLGLADPLSCTTTVAFFAVPAPRRLPIFAARWAPQVCVALGVVAAELFTSVELLHIFVLGQVRAQSAVHASLECACGACSIGRTTRDGERQSGNGHKRSDIHTEVVCLRCWRKISIDLLE